MTPTGPGLVALVGGSEHLPGCEPIDQHLLDASSSEGPVTRAVVSVLPFASSLRTRARAVGQAVEWWDALGADVLVADRDPATAVPVVQSADIVVLTGGVPDRLASRLVASPVWAAVAARHRAGAHVVGSSSGAMVLGAARQSVRPPFRVVPALGLVPGAAVAPHHGRPTVQRIVRLRAHTHPHLAILGIADGTALVGRNGAYVVRGTGHVVVARGSAVRRHEPGEQVHLPCPRPDPATVRSFSHLVPVDGSRTAGTAT